MKIILGVCVSHKYSPPLVGLGMVIICTFYKEQVHLLVAVCYDIITLYIIIYEQI